MLKRKSSSGFFGMVSVRNCTLIYTTTTFLCYAASAYAAFNLLTISCPHCTTSPSNTHNTSTSILDSADAQARLGARLLFVSIWYAFTMLVASSFGFCGVVNESIRTLKLFRMMSSIDVILSFLLTFLLGPIGLTLSIKDFVCDAPTKIESNHCWDVWRSSVYRFIGLTLFIIVFKVYLLGCTHVYIRQCQLRQRKLRPRPSIVLVPPPQSSTTQQVAGFVVPSPTQKHKRSHSIKQGGFQQDGGPIALAIRPGEGLLPNHSFTDQYELLT
ncbi:hypothetical protein E3P92_00529 [Wallemia ichthyophaga]|uniref:Uncharacterized protein n=2 Tax=Wallemia ichthyophaga TaxID=245174 RepID=A0A4T0J747_WALIC|nr:uncharacterized protein J056_004323 [Wallemia ichthyophaga EXF-994]TIA70548.1 hypothetical protein E3P91_03046 [Wallemia ichthyophaga]EOR01537.1 hypothetical protein J056_004323 [Wallemia ichthyophaga EXF-994]TIA79863.1 hypothetical protein E3P98_03039 [Wallemia ichthyophaga]TIB03439.1 hypothetical protein E3P95_00535 [Wallemia ichthyophaga]TIB04230.1 hypothetical protein E3P94_00735 [Wallemia ichthyophaga]